MHNGKEGYEYYSTYGAGFESMSGGMMGYDDPVKFTSDTDPAIVKSVADGIKRVFRNSNRPHIRSIFSEYRADQIAKDLLSQHLSQEEIEAVFGD